MMDLMELRNEEGLQMLQEAKLKRFTDVYTSDDVHLGGVVRIHHRPEDEVDPGLKLWAAYLEIFAEELGEHIFVPTDFVDEYDPEANKIFLSVDEATIERETWNNIPDFVARHLSTVEELPFPEGYKAG